MCLGLGCNAAGVVGCRIIDSRRERLIAIITNSFVPCNGRFPTLILLTSVLAACLGRENMYSGYTALILSIIIVLCIMSTFLMSFILGKTILRGTPSAFTLELPPYRRPQIVSSIIHSVFDRTLSILGRAAVIALPAGLVVWILGNVYIGDNNLFTTASNALNPFASAFGMDGIILLAFILALPANEIVMPIAIMGYMSGSSLAAFGSFSQLFQTLSSGGWTWLTALCTMVFVMFHFPCSTTLITIYKETQSIKWTLLSALLPTAYGLMLCFILKALFSGI